MRGIAAIGEEQAGAAALAQFQHHAGDRVAHVIADRPAAEGQPAEYGRRLVDRPVQHPPRHLGDAGKAGIEFDRVEIGRAKLVQFHRLADRNFHPGAVDIAIAGQDRPRLMRGGAVADIDPLRFRNAAPPGFASRHHDEPCALVDRRIGDLQLGIGEGDRAVLVTGRHHISGADRLPDPGGRIGGGHFGKAAPDLAAFGLSLGQGLAQVGAQGVLVERIDIGRHDQPVALRIAQPDPVRRIAQGIALLPAGCGRLARPGGAQCLATGNQRDPDLARADPVRRLVQQQDRTVAIGALRLGQLGPGRADCGGHRRAGIGNIGKSNLRHDP